MHAEVATGWPHRSKNRWPEKSRRLATTSRKTKHWPAAVDWWHCECWRQLLSFFVAFQREGLCLTGMFLLMMIMINSSVLPAVCQVSAKRSLIANARISVQRRKYLHSFGISSPDVALTRWINLTVRYLVCRRNRSCLHFVPNRLFSKANMKI